MSSFKTHNEEHTENAPNSGLDPRNSKLNLKEALTIHKSTPKTSKCLAVGDCYQWGLALIVYLDSQYAHARRYKAGDITELIKIWSDHLTM